jgi:hypothetical protein
VSVPSDARATPDRRPLVVATKLVAPAPRPDTIVRERLAHRPALLAAFAVGGTR